MVQITDQAAPGASGRDDEMHGITAPLLVVTGLQFEAAIARTMPDLVADDASQRPLRILCGLGSAALAARIEAALAEGCAGVLSFGTVGALNAALAPGAWVVATEVLADDRRYTADPTWRDALLQRLQPEHAASAIFINATTPVATPEAKFALRAASGADVVDMESALVARLASARGLPFAACRVVVDPASRALPPAALAAVRADGGTDVIAVIGSLLAQPGQWRALRTLAHDARIARTSLRHGRARLGRNFALPDLTG